MEPKVVVNGKEYPFVTEGDLTLGEAAEIEEICGQGYDLSQIGARGLLALAYVSVKRTDSSVTLGFMKALKADEIDVKVEESDPIPPTSSGVSAGSATIGSDGSSESSGGSPAGQPVVTGTPV